MRPRQVARPLAPFACLLAHLALGAPSLLAQQSGAEAARAFREANGPRILREYADFLSIPNVASDSAGIWRNALYIRDELAERGVMRLLVVLGDVAGAEAADLLALFDALEGLGGRGVVLAPSRDGGTSALLRAPHAVIPNHFGKESAAAHRDLARSGGIPYSELPLPSLAIDLDRVEDVEALLRTQRGADRTRALLRELGFGGGT